jgi:mersacidin/lichenicidin family type 2 lantibiotic
MTPAQIVRAWKDKEFRQGLSETDQALLPEHPSGLVELAFADLAYVAGNVGGSPTVPGDPNTCETLPLPRWCGGNTGRGCYDTRDIVCTHTGSPQVTCATFSAPATCTLNSNC